MRKDLEEEFEEKNSDLKEKLSEEEYEQKKREWIEEEMEKAWELEDSNRRTEKAVSEKKEAKIDAVTGLERRECFYKNLNKKAKELLDLKEGADAQEKIEKLEEQDPEDFQSENNPAVMMADVSYLNLVNKVGHQSGDQLLKKAGDSLRRLEDAQGFRHGGDELTAIFDNNREASEKAQQLEEDFKSQKVKMLEDRYGLRPKIDVATASFSEALEVMEKTLQDEEVKEDAFTKDPLKVFNDTWVEIADKRTFRNKAKERIKILMDKYENDPGTFKEIFNYLFKGAYDISENKIRELVEYRKQEGEERIDREIEYFITQEEEKGIDALVKQEESQRGGDKKDRADSKFERIKAEAIFYLDK